MKKKNKVGLVIGIILIICALIFLGVTIVFNMNAQKDEENVKEDVKKIVANIKKNCNKEYKRYVIKNGKSDTISDVYSVKNAIFETDTECDVTYFYTHELITNFIKKEVKMESSSDTFTSLKDNGEVIYYNPVTNKTCSKDSENCLKWYVFNDSEEALTSTLILDHNIKDTAKHEVAKSLLKDLTKDYVVEARLLNLDDLKTLLGKTVKKEDIFFDSKLAKPLKSCYKGDTSSCKYGWLYDNTALNCKDYGCLNNTDKDITGYWLSDTDGDKAYRVYKDGRVTLTNAIEGSTGIRPVIEVAKSISK